jgi:hypothetical protein
LGRRSIKNKSDEYLLHGFILCRINKESPNILWIDLVCSRRNSKVGKLLLEMAEEESKLIAGLKLIQLYALPDERLKRWYQQQGYQPSVLYTYDPRVKGFLLYKFLV